MAKKFKNDSAFSSLIGEDSSGSVADPSLLSHSTSQVAQRGSFEIEETVLEDVGEEEVGIYEEEAEPEIKPSKHDLLTDSDISWKEPEQLSYSSFTSAEEEEAVERLLLRASVKVRGESTDRIYLKDDYHETVNNKRGWTLVETEEDEFGKKVTRKFYPRVAQKKKFYKQKLPMRITYNKLDADETNVVEEEDLVDEEMEVEEITDTILVTTKDEDGNEVIEKVEVVRKIVNDPSKKKKFMKLKMINNIGRTVEESIELNDDSKRTNEILIAAAPHMKKKFGEKSAIFFADNVIDREVDHTTDGSRASLSYSDWMKQQHSKKTQVMKGAIENLKKALDDRKMLKQLNSFLGRKLCEHLDLRGQKDPDFQYNVQRENSDVGKANYKKALLELNDVVNHSFAEGRKREKLIASASRNLQKATNDLKELRQTFYDLEEWMVKELSPGACERRSFCSSNHHDIINQQKAMDANLSKVGFDFLKSQLVLEQLKEKKAQYEKSIDNLEKVDFIHYETLREKTKDMNDKLDLKYKYVMAMKDTMTQRVQALAHVRLKREHLCSENHKLNQETSLVIEELKALRNENIKVRQQRRTLEKQLNKVLEKEGIEKYPYLVKDALTVESKSVEQKDLLSHLVNKCVDMRSDIERKVEDHKKGVENYKKMKNKRQEEKKKYSLNFG